VKSFATENDLITAIKGFADDSADNVQVGDRVQIGSNIDDSFIVDQAYFDAEKIKNSYKGAFPIDDPNRDVENDFLTTTTEVYDYEFYGSETNTTTVNNETVTFIDETSWTTYHSVSGSYAFDNFDVLVGVANVFDEKPPRISASGDQVGNAARFSQYDFIGRRVFANITYSF